MRFVKTMKQSQNTSFTYDNGISSTSYYYDARGNTNGEVQRINSGNIITNSFLTSYKMPSVGAGVSSYQTKTIVTKRFVSW